MVELKIGIVLIGDERHRNIIKPLGKAIEHNGSILMSIPTYRICSEGERIWDIISLDIGLSDFVAGIENIKQCLKDLELLDISILKFKEREYNLLNEFDIDN